MKKIISAFLLIALVFFVSSCKKNDDTATQGNDGTEVNSNTGAQNNNEEPHDIVTTESGVEIDYGKSEMFSKDDMNTAINMINDKFTEWRDCKVYSIKYGGDEKNADYNVEWANEVIENQNFTEVMEFESHFHSPTEATGPWGESDAEYEDYQFWFARSEGGDWQLVSWGY